MRKLHRMSRKKSPSITDYDKKEYDYSKYWERENRQYEHRAEILALKRLLKKTPENRRDFFVDFGGGYGRLMPVYAPFFRHVTLVDYSIKNLEKGVELAEKYGITNISFVAANLYHLPFKDKSINSGSLIRVIHHIENLRLLFSELGRVLNSNLVIDCPNKRHFLAMVRSLLSGNLKETLSDTPYQQPHREDSQDFTGGPQIFLNYNPKTLEKIAAPFKFRRIKRLSVSNLRSSTLKKIIPLAVLNGIESVLQHLFAIFLFGPQIWILFEKQTKTPSDTPTSIHDLIFCPKCNGKVRFRQSDCKCTKCGKIWKVDGKIWDFRYK